MAAFEVQIVLQWTDSKYNRIQKETSHASKYLLLKKYISRHGHFLFSCPHPNWVKQSNVDLDSIEHPCLSFSSKILPCLLLNNDELDLVSTSCAKKVHFTTNKSFLPTIRRHRLEFPPNTVNCSDSRENSTGRLCHPGLARLTIRILLFLFLIVKSEVKKQIGRRWLCHPGSAKHRIQWESQSPGLELGKLLD